MQHRQRRDVATVMVETAAGRVLGVRQANVTAFLGVPYAAPITIHNRFDAPEAVAPWVGIREATQLGPVCPQMPTYGPVGTAATSGLPQGEEFLTLNIRTPDRDGTAPVLVWVHGGGYAVGSANEPVLQSGAFAASGIVEVTVNYRLGALGFLTFDGAAENRGLLDLLAALHWVRENIALFGGDPTRVAFGGRSAGGFATAAVMAMPAAHGLFARAIPMSGAATGVAGWEDAARLTHRLCAKLGTSEAQIRDLPIEVLLVAQRDLCNESYERHSFDRDGDAAMLGVPFVPVSGGETLPLHPLAAARAGQTTPVPMMIGCTTAEYLTHSTVLPATLDFAEVATRLHERVRPMGLTGLEIVARYRSAFPGHDAHGIWRAAAGDLVFQNPAILFARAHATKQPVRKYLFGEILPNEGGAPHGAEVGYLWHREGIDISGVPARHQIADPGLATPIHDIWRDFIAANDGGGISWPTYSEAAPQLLHLGSGPAHVAADPFDARPALWM